MPYVLIRDGKYVAKRGARHAYTRNIEWAETYPTAEEARRNAFGSEVPLPIDGSAVGTGPKPVSR
jgi:hypothetical protein